MYVCMYVCQFYFLDSRHGQLKFWTCIFEVMFIIAHAGENATRAGGALQRAGGGAEQREGAPRGHEGGAEERGHPRMLHQVRATLFHREHRGLVR